MDELELYHKGRASRPDRIPPEQRKFVAWDGEGITYTVNTPQSYVLFGCSTGDRLVSKEHLHTFDILDFIVDVGRRHPDAFHVGFAFNYDSNMIVRSLQEESLRRLHERGKLTLRKRGVGVYHVQFRPSKWFSVTRYGANYDRKSNPHDKITVRIYDLFGFFAKSFVKAYEEIVGPIPDVIKEGKDRRDSFSLTDMGEIEKYWTAEIEALRVLAEELRKRLYGAGLRITQWHGPGALAAYALRQHGVRQHMAQCPDPVRQAARFGYAGGRFEIYKLGRVQGPIYSMDINSAYPFALSRLPSLATGEWVYNPGPVRSPRIRRFGIYHVRLLAQHGGSFLERAPGPLFHRDKMGNISFPWIVDGWYWSPEVINLFNLDPSRYEIVEGWEYLNGYTELPFSWIPEMYAQRREWKAKGYGAQLALKLCMNSIYGKLAQRVGWNEKQRLAPTWHQLEWAGWITSHCRAMLWDVMARIPWEHLIAVETDGLYTTLSPEQLGISNGSDLGAWEVGEYDEILYVQSGMAWLRRGSQWQCKRRGLDARTFSLDDCRSYLQCLAPNQAWMPYLGETTRFVGLGSALSSATPTKHRHCVWRTTTREIRPGQGGKRIHVHGQCKTCADGLTAWEQAHEMNIRSLAYSHPQSYPHDIPWEGEADYPWRGMSDLHEEVDYG